jgi:hypothetical protein
MPRSKSNLPQNQVLKWNVDLASREFGLAIATLKKALGKISAIPDADGLYSTSQLLSAVYGALDVERLKTQAQITRKYTLENQITEGEVVNRKELMRVLSAIADAMVSRITASNLERHLQEDLLAELSSIPIVLEGAAARQTKLPARHNTQADGEDF